MSAKDALEPPFLFAFLRGVNLGKHNKVPMKPLVEALPAAGLPNAAYLLASGNLVFGGTERPSAKLRAGLERLIEREFGVTTSAVFRTPSELRELLAANPFRAPAGGSVHVALWDDEVSEEVGARARRELAAGDYGRDQVALADLADRAAYILFASSSQASKLSGALIERRLGVTATVRNVNTFERLLARWV